MCSHSKCHFEGQKGQIWAFVIYLHEYLRNGTSYNQSLYETHIVGHIWSLSWPLALDDLLRSNQGNWVFNGLYLLNGACYDTSFYETHIVSHIWSFSWLYDLWSWMTFKIKIKVIEFLMGCISCIVLVMTKVYMKHI